MNKREAIQDMRVMHVNNKMSNRTNLLKSSQGKDLMNEWSLRAASAAQGSQSLEERKRERERENERD